ncbi:cytochrome P450 [Nonomuraea rhizosphaerae]|uniref:cytochrome P450 n=1 Tax=Nonomuraea rhizosphaerae TaxID=2665663 RepID=UPI001C5D6D1B|nr:cytochrome P450 [Nonomuraea rhizosphaerae]
MTDLLDGYPDHADAVPLYGSRIHDEPAELFEEMRRKHGPIVPVLLDNDIPAWLVIGYRELHHVTSQPQLFGRDPRRWNMREHIPPDWPSITYVTWQPTVMFSEGEERRRRSGAIGDALDSVDRTELTMICERVADLVIDEFAGDGRAELITQFAYRIPAQVVIRLYGMPESDLPDMVRVITHLLDGAKDASDSHSRVLEGMVRLAVTKRARPEQDITSHLLASAARLTDDEVVQDLMVLVIASYSSCANWIGNALRLMLVDDHFSMTLQGGRSSVGEALNEVLWKDPPVRNMPSRWAVRDCDLAGRRVRKGDLLVLGIAAANADPQVQPASHEESGANRAHMSFSHGEYGCPFPAPELGEIIAKTAIEVLLDRLPDARLAIEPHEVRWRQTPWVRGLESLPVMFSPTGPVGRGSLNPW